jgi:tetratricopeptide (TPR) repeat protein
LQPDNAWNHYRLALAHDGLGDTAAVRKALERAIELDPKHLPARVALARLLLAQQESQQFEAQLVALRQMQPEHPDVLLLEAALANSRGDDAGVLEKLEQAFAVAPAPATVQALAIEKVRRGDSGAGVQLLEDWLSGHEDDAATRMTLAEVYGSSDRVDAAMAQYRRVLDASPDNVVALNNLAWHLRKRDPKQAVIFAERAHKLAPDSGDVLDTLALALLENKDLRQAQARIEQALKVAPDNLALRYHAALIRHAAGDTGGALIILEPLLESEKEFPERREAAEFVASIKK